MRVCCFIASSIAPEGIVMKQIIAVVMLSALAAGMSASAGAEVPAVANALTPEQGVTVAGRLAPKDIKSLRQAGVRYVVDLTADAETPEFDEAAAVRTAGIGYANLPIRGAADLTRQNVAAFDDLLRGATRPMLVHCASGNRVGAMVALRAAWIDGSPVEEAVSLGKAWGLKGLETEVRDRIAAGSSQP
jgi:uncharacterized protein (TIGR01244 family)